MHEISIVGGRAEAVFAGGAPPWHRLGDHLPEHITVWEALERAGLTWRVHQLPLAVRMGESLIDVDTHVANVRGDDGRVLGVVGSGFQPLQHAAQAELIEALVGEGAAVVEACGALREGRRQFWTLKLPEELIVGTDDPLRRYLVACNAHDGTLAFRIFWTSVRVVCSNTFQLALRDAQSGVCVRHTGNVHERIEEARRVLQLADRHFRLLGEHLDELAEVPLAPEEADELFAEVVPMPADARPRQVKRVESVRTQLRDNFIGGVGADVAGLTLFGAVNAVTEFASHQRPVRGRTAAEQAERRFEHLLLGGPAAVLEQRAFELACARLEAA